jgi:hypothetical protein
MNARQWTVLGTVLTLLVLTAAALIHIDRSQRLGRPGVKLGPEPTYMTGGQIVRTQSVSLPIELPDFVSEPVELTALELNWLPKDTLFGRGLYHSKDGFTNLLSVVLMGTDRTSIHKPQYCLDGQGWRIEKTETVTIPIARPYPYGLQAMKLTASRTVVDSAGRRAQARGIYIYWFVADNQLTPFHGERMWWMARDLVWSGTLQRWAYVACFTVCWPGQEELFFNRMKELVASSVPEFQLAAGPPSSRVTAVVCSDTAAKARE